jgi:hypothetical protein
MAWLSGYSKRKELVLTGGASGALSDFQLSIAVSYEAAMQGDFDDIRFTQSNGTTEIDAWLETKTDDTSATVWVEFPSTPANTVEQDYYMYYGNGSAVSDWDIANTFIFGNEFDSLTAWSTVSGTPSVSGGELTLNSGDGVYRDVTFPSLYCVHGRIKDASDSTDSSRFYIGTSNAPGDSGPYIGWRSDGDIYEYSAGWASGGSYTSNVYNIIEMRNVNPTAHTWDMAVDGVVGITDAKCKSDRPHVGYGG